MHTILQGFSMKYVTLLVSFLLFSSLSYSAAFDLSDSPFRYKLALTIASIPEVKDLSSSLTDMQTEQLTLQILTEDDGYLNEVEEDLALFTCANESKNTFQWAIKHNETGKTVGLVGLYNVDKRRASGTLALYFKPEYRKKDLIAEAMKAILDFGHTQIGFNRVDFYLYPDKRGFTETSLLCDSFGLIEVGEMPELIYHSGCYHTFILYCSLRENFEKILK